jgi:hypothetical protein
MSDVIEPVGDDYPTDEPPKSKPTVRGVAIVGVRIVAGTVGLAVAAAAIAGAVFLPIPTVSRAPEAVTVTPVATAQQLVCPGALLRLGDETGQGATTASAIGSATVRFDSTDGTVTSVPLDDSDAAPGAAVGSPVLISSPAGSDAVLVSGAQAQVAAGSEAAGLAVADCAGVATETWLVGGSTSVGRTTLVTLANPSDTSATVSLSISGESGEVSAPGATGIVVQPHGQRVLSLAGFAPDVESPVVHVVSRGGQIVANLQQTTVRGLEAGGVDIVGATEPPSLTQVIPGVRVANSAELQTRSGESGFDDLATVVRVFVPGDEPTSAEVSVVADDGSATGASFSVDLDPGVVEDLPVDGLVDGSYTVSVTTEVPVVAGVRVSTVATSVIDPLADPVGGASDFAWLAAAHELGDSALVTVAPGASPRLHFFNSGSDSVDVELEAVDGDDLELTVDARSSASIDVEPGATYELGGVDGLVAAVSYAGQSGVAGFTVQPPAVSAGPIDVLP